MYHIIIPARLDSTRLPEKALLQINGKSIVRLVYEQAMQCPRAAGVYVATDSQKIMEEVSSFGGKAVMTSNLHVSGTDRCSEAANILGIRKGFIINLQGDEPFIEPSHIEALYDALSEDTEVHTLVRKISSADDLANPNVVKTVVALGGKALYFSRLPVPYIRDAKGVEGGLRDGLYFRHIGIYAFKAQTLLDKIPTLPESPLERSEKLEQLRWLEHGLSIKVTETDYEGIGIDTLEDYEKAIKKAS